MPEATAIIKLVGKDQASAEIKKVRQSIGGLEKSAKTTSGNLKQLFGGVAGSFGLSSGALATGGVAAAIALIGAQALKAGAAFEELDSKARFIYQETFPAIQAEAQKVAKEVGRASSQILGMAADYGAIIKPMGIAIERAGEMSLAFAKLAVDLSSFHNKSEEEAFIALRSAITGETEPMKRFGVVMTEANLAAFALNQQIKTQVKDMNQAQKTALRYAFIMEATSDAQGDAERTAGSATNQWRRMKGQVTELFEELSKPAIPAAAGALQVLNAGLKLGTMMVHEFNNVITESIGYLDTFASFAIKASAAMGLVQQAKLPDGTGIMAGLSDKDIRSAFGPAGSSKSFTEIEAEEKAAALRKEIEALAGAMGGAAGDAATEEEKMKEIAEDILSVVKDIVSSMGEQADLNKEQIEQRREDLKLREKLGVLAGKEEIELERINRRMLFQKDVLDDMVKKWEDVQDAIGASKDRLTDLRKELQDTAADLKKSLKGIDDDLNKSLKGIDDRTDEERMKNIVELLRERGKLLRETNGTLSGDQGRELGRINDALVGATPEELTKARQLMELNELGTISAEAEAERQALIKEAEKEKQALLEEEKAKRAEILGQIQREREMMDELKVESVDIQKQIVDAMKDREEQTKLVYQNLEKATEDHVKKQIEQFNTLKATLESLVGANASIAGFESGISSKLGVGGLVPNANGGIYDKPTAALIGEAGYPEAVIPMPFGNVPVKLQGNAGGSVTIYLGGVTVREEADEDRLVRKLTRKIQLTLLASPA